jgi:hypothetical protein
MKKFKQFKSEQQHITEVGPYASAFMGAMGVIGLGMAGFKLFKSAKEKIKGYRETKAEKKDNQENGVFVQIKKWDNDKGKLVTQSIEIAAAGSSEANMSNEDIEKKKKELQKKEDPKNDRMQAAFDEKERLQGKEDKKDKDIRGGIEDEGDAETYFANNKSAPRGWEDVRSKKEKDSNVDFKGKILKNKDAVKYREKQSKLAKQLTPAQKEKQSALKKKMKDRQGTNIKKRNLEHLLTFGEFISEDVMSDLLKATKSKKDSEITLDDGADIPIDPLTASILVKYIEELGSSEKSKTINKIQRTERAFMKVLGQAHGE